MKPFLFLLILVPTVGMAKSLPKGNLFSESARLEISLKYDFQRLRAERDSLRDTGIPGILTFQDKELAVQVAPRGKGSFRCPQPQLKIDFSKTAAVGTPFEGFKKIKLFTAGVCLEAQNDPQTDKRIIGNYLHYKFYEEIAPVHYKTRLVQIHYVDSSGTVKDYTQAAFFLEPDKSLEQRLGLTRIENEDIYPLKDRLAAEIDPKVVPLTHAFQFFIGNLDYGIPGSYYPISDSVEYYEKNTHLYRSTSGSLTAVVFDWDFSRMNYVGPVCGYVAQRFFLSRGIDMTCIVSDLISLYQTELNQFKERSAFLHYRPFVLEKFTIWREKNKELLESLGPEYNLGLDALATAMQELK